MKCSRWVTYTCWKTVHVCFPSVNVSTSQDFLFIGNLLGPHGYKGECVQAHHVDNNVPVFRFQCELQHGLILLSLAGGNPEIHVQAQNFNKLLQDLGGGRKLEKPKLIASHGRKVPRHLLRAVRFIIVPVLRKLRPVVPHGPSMLRRVLRIAQLMRLGSIICLQVTS